ncbi:unnamed protein product, partial [Larinioides sclopetarius]
MWKLAKIRAKVYHLTIMHLVLVAGYRQSPFSTGQNVDT